MRLNYFSGDGRDSDAVYVDAKTREDRLANNLMTTACNAGRAQDNDLHRKSCIGNSSFLRIDISRAVKSTSYATAARKGYKPDGKTHSIYGKKSKRPFVPTWCKFCGAVVAYGTISKMRLRSATTWIDTCDSCTANR